MINVIINILQQRCVNMNNLKIKILTEISYNLVPNQTCRKGGLYD